MGVHRRGKLATTVHPVRSKKATMGGGLYTLFHWIFPVTERRLILLSMFYTHKKSQDLDESLKLIGG